MMLLFGFQLVLLNSVGLAVILGSTDYVLYLAIQFTNAKDVGTAYLLSGGVLAELLAARLFACYKH